MQIDYNTQLHTLRTDADKLYAGQVLKSAQNNFNLDEASRLVQEHRFALLSQEISQNPELKAKYELKLKHIRGILNETKQHFEMILIGQRLRPAGFKLPDYKLPEKEVSEIKPVGIPAAQLKPFAATAEKVNLTQSTALPVKEEKPGLPSDRLAALPGMPVPSVSAPAAAAPTEVEQLRAQNALLQKKLELLANFVSGIKIEELLPECPITLEPLKKGTVLSDGLTYSEAKAKEWLVVQKKNTSPKSGKVLTHPDFMPNNFALEEVAENLEKFNVERAKVLDQVNKLK